MGKTRVGRSSKYTEAFKRQLVAESKVAGATVPLVSRRHGVPIGRIYSWRGDARFQPNGSEIDGFTPVDVTEGDGGDTQSPQPSGLRDPRSAPRIEITLENGRRLSVSDGVDAGFVLELARGLAA